MKIKNAFTVDVEDYFQVEALSEKVNRKDWGKFESRVEKNTDVIMSILDENNISGTFFILGWVAKRHPNIVKNISDAGHEIASHGMSHQLIYNQSPEVFRNETRDSKKLIEDLCQKEVIGYRAATYSITKKSLWALDILAEEGFKYDSSIFPMRHDRYGIPDINPLPHLLTTPNGLNLVEFPITTVKTKHLTLPVAGGGYFRIFPYMYTRWGLKRTNKNNQPFVFYIHPWEVDPEQPRVDGLSTLSKFRHYSNLKICHKRLEKLTRDFDFTTMDKVLSSLNFLK